MGDRPIDFDTAKRVVSDTIRALHEHASAEIKTAAERFTQQLAEMEEVTAKARQIAQEEMEAARTLLLDAMDQLRAEKAELEKHVKELSTQLNAWKRRVMDL
jgi:hypothetical protein